MQIPESWLRSMVDPPMSTAELAHLLTMSGLEIESCDPVAPRFTGVVTAKVLGVEKHPNADRLTVCRVDDGEETLTVVCGAPNVRAGKKVPLAKPGALLPVKDGPPLEIKVAKMRGVESQGMLCSASELGLSQDRSGLLELSAEAPIGRDLRDWLALDDQVFTIKLTPNRADCLSVLGVAREVAALTRAQLRPPATPQVPAKIDATHPVRITHSQGCGRFTGRVIRNVDAAAPTPDWMKQRLERAGQRSISALVDVTNYVMLELGRPLHVYDLDKLRGAINVRFGVRGEKVLLLNEREVEVDESVLCITDDSGVIGLAGIMGGEATKADSGTRNIFLEAAFFFPDVIAGRTRRWNFASDAAYRFERGVDFDNNIAGIERATALILEICGGEPGPTVDQVERLPERRSVPMRVARARKVIGVPIPDTEMADAFARLALPFVKQADTLVVTPPSYRFDLQIEEDLIEEVARIHGFERIPGHLPRAPARMHTRPEAQLSLHALRERLAASDYQEVVNFSFAEAQWEADFAGELSPIRLLNPIASHLSVMRSTLIGSLVANLRYNLARKLPRIRVFEIGRVFLRDPTATDTPFSVAGLRQPVRMAAVAFGAAYEQQWGEPERDVDFYDMKGDLEAVLAPRRARFEAAAHAALHPGRSARVVLDGAAVGWVGELHPKWRLKYELPGPVTLFEVDAEALTRIEVPRYQAVLRFPAVRRDIAVEVDMDLPVQAILDGLKNRKTAIVDDIAVFDVYRGKGIEQGKKGLAFRVLLQDTQKTLTDAEVDAAIAGLREVLEKQYGAKLRQ